VQVIVPTVLVVVTVNAPVSAPAATLEQAPTPTQVQPAVPATATAASWRTTVGDDLIVIGLAAVLLITAGALATWLVGRRNSRRGPDGRDGQSYRGRG
jgi:hypothetical protein